MSRYIIGIDYSLNSPAVCLLDREHPTISSSRFCAFAQCKKHLKAKHSNLDIVNTSYPVGLARYLRNSDLVLSVILAAVAQDGSNPWVFVEGYSFGSRSASTLDLAENVGVLKYRAFREHGITIEPVPPTVVKKLATGKGNSKKWKMYESWLKDDGFNLMALLDTKNPESNPLSDVVDSFYVAKAGLAILNSDIS